MALLTAWIVFGWFAFTMLGIAVLVWLEPLRSPSRIAPSRPVRRARRPAVPLARACGDCA